MYKCNDCHNLAGFVATYRGISCIDCGSSNVVENHGPAPRSALCDVVELERMYALPDTRTEPTGFYQFRG